MQIRAKRSRSISILMYLKHKVVVTTMIGGDWGRRVIFWSATQIQNPRIALMRILHHRGLLMSMCLPKRIYQWGIYESVLSLVHLYLGTFGTFFCYLCILLMTDPISRTVATWLARASPYTTRWRVQFHRVRYFLLLANFHFLIGKTVKLLFNIIHKTILNKFYLYHLH